MKELPKSVVSFRRTPLFAGDTVPAALLKSHRTGAGVWGKIHVEKGILTYTIGNDEHHTLTPECPGIIEPEVTHAVTPAGDVAFFVEFFKDVED